MRGRIPLTQGQVAKVDETDWEELRQHTWYAQWAPGTRSFYAVRQTPGLKRRQQTECMHRRIVNLKPGGGLQVDHINHDTTDNRRENLRTVTHRANHGNRRLQSLYGVGVSFDANCRHRPYRALAQVDNRMQYIGMFATSEEAQAARKAWLQERGLA